MEEEENLRVKRGSVLHGQVNLWAYAKINIGRLKATESLKPFSVTLQTKIKICNYQKKKKKKEKKKKGRRKLVPLSFW